jgi:hypothetical protein
MVFQIIGNEFLPCLARPRPIRPGKADGGRTPGLLRPANTQPRVEETCSSRRYRRPDGRPGGIRPEAILPLSSMATLPNEGATAWLSVIGRSHEANRVLSGFRGHLRRLLQLRTSVTRACPKTDWSYSFQPHTRHHTFDPGGSPEARRVNTIHTQEPPSLECAGNRCPLCHPPQL